MEDAARLDDSGEGTLERPMRGQQPKPPPRLDSYRIMRGSGTGSRSASGSEIYERLPADTGSLGDELEDRLRMSSDEDDGHDSDIYILNQRSSNGGPEHLVKPSQMKQSRRKKEAARPQQPHLRQPPQPQQPPPGKHLFFYLFL